MKMKNFRLAGMALVGLLAISCSDKVEDGIIGPDTKKPVITAQVVSFEGTDYVVDGEDHISDMQACLFENGKMTKVFDNLVASDGTYRLHLDNHGGTVYMLANTAGLIDLPRLQEQDISESEWLKTTLAPEKEETHKFFTGILDLDEHPTKTTNFSLTMKRGNVRFDLLVDEADSIRVKKLEITNVARHTFLFPQHDETLSPDDTEHRGITVDFPEPVNRNVPGVCYVYEQHNNQMTVQVTIDDRGHEKVLSKPLEAFLKRNTVHTIRVRKNGVNISLDIDLEAWEPGSDTEIIPLSAKSGNV